MLKDAGALRRVGGGCRCVVLRMAANLLWMQAAAAARDSSACRETRVLRSPDMTPVCSHCQGLL